MLLKRKRIFIIEDNVSNSFIMQQLLEQQGAKTSFELWTGNTLHRLKQFAPVDVILLDLMFPNGVTGYDVFQMIRTDTLFDDVPIVAVSAADASTAIPKTKELGFSGFIAKPVDFELFPSQVARIIAKEKVWHYG